MKPFELKEVEDHILGDLANSGMRQEDKHLNRRVVYLIGYRLLVNDGNLVRWLKGEKPLRKYDEDWSRMQNSFKASVILAEKDGDSRQLMVFNSENYSSAKQCFTQMQFVKDHSFDLDEYVLVVSQRSGDVAKLADDLIFFGSICRKWEVALKTKVRQIVVNYAHIHHEE